MKKLSFLHPIFVPFVLLVLSSFSASAQNTNFLNINVIVSDTLGKTLKDVAIYNSKQNLIGITDNFGKTSISARYGDVITFSRVNYEQKYMTVSDEYMLVCLKAKTNILPEAEIIENVPHLAYSNKQVWVSDYKVNDAGMYLILDNNSEHSLIFLSHEQDTLAKAKIAKKFDYLYEDAFGNIHLLSNDSAYQTYYDGEKLNMLYPVDIQTFKRKLMPVQVITDSLLILQQYASMWQEIFYVSVNRNTKETKTLIDCYGPTREWGRYYYRDMMKDGLIDRMEMENPMFPNIMEMLGVESSRYRFERNKEHLDELHPGKSAEIIFQNQVIGRFGELHPNQITAYDLSKSSAVVLEMNLDLLLTAKVSITKMTPISRFPSVSRDLALVVAKEVSARDLIKAIKVTGRGLVSEAQVFDVYEGEHIEEGKKSIAISVTYASDDHTLSDKEITEMENRIKFELTKQFKAELRS